MTDIDAVPCPECGVPFGEHTMVDYRAHTAVNVDFQATEPTLSDLAGKVIVDHLDIAATVLEAELQTGDRLVIPGIEFRFRSSADGPLQPVVFTCDDPSMFKSLRNLVAAACDAAPMRAKQRAREIRRNEDGQ